jgi:hypothetical protein
MIRYFQILQSSNKLWINNQAVLNIILAAGFVLGLYLRWHVYYLNVAFWMDTAALANNLIERSYAELFGQLSSSQAAPVGFLVLSKFVGASFGYSEYALNFVPFFFSVGALTLFLVLCLKVFEKRGAALAFFPFVVCPSALYYAGHFKQYSSDLFFTVLILLFTYDVLQKNFTKISILHFTIVGIVCIWFSLTHQ